MISVYRLSAGPDGHSHVQRGTIHPDLFIDAQTLQFRETPASASRDLHTAPTAQYVFMLTGVVEFNTAGGEKFTLRPGNVLLVADTTGSGHGWRVIGDDPWRRACVVPPSDIGDHFTVEDEG